MPSSPLNSSVESISAFFPCCNDEATIATMVSSALSTLDDTGVDGEVIVVDDGSTDSSPEVLRALSASNSRVRIITHPEYRGYGAALLSGFDAATREWVFYTDGDGQFDPSELALMIDAASDEVDLVQGYKISRADNLLRAIIGRVYHRFVATMFRLKIRDTDCDFRLIRRALLDRVHLTHTTGVICVEMVRKFQDAGARVVEVPVHHFPRLHGKSQFFRLSSVARSLRDLAFMWMWMMVLRRGRA